MHGRIDEKDSTMTRTTLIIAAGWVCWCSGMALAWADSTALDAAPPALRASTALRPPGAHTASPVAATDGLSLKSSPALVRHIARPLADVNALVAASPSAAGR
jgi:hypothetical protein